MRARQVELALMGAVALVGATAFVHLMALPPFVDEGTQLRLIGRLLEQGEWRQPLYEGKPLEIWLMAPFAHLAGTELAAVRAVHVLIGVCATLLTYRLARALGDRIDACVCGALFAVCPFLVYQERLALADVLMCAAGIWVLLGVLAILQRPNARTVVRLAAALLLAALSKLPVGFIFLTALPLALALLPSAQRRALLAPPARSRLILACAPVLLLAAAVCLVALMRVRQGHAPGFGIQDLLEVGGGFSADIAATMGVAPPRLLNELATQLSPAVLVVGLLGLALGAVRGDWRLRWLILQGALPLLMIAGVAHFWYSRYLLFALPPLLVAAVVGWRTLWARSGRIEHTAWLIVLAMCAALWARQSARLILDPATARWSPIDRVQYVEGWGSGYGYPEAAAYLRAAARPPEIIYALDGHSAAQLQTYLPRDWRPRVQPLFYGADGQELPEAAQRRANLLAHLPAWIIAPEALFDRSLLAAIGDPQGLQVQRLAAFDKPGRRTQVSLYSVARLDGPD
jgi:hypothetical protein